MFRFSTDAFQPHDRLDRWSDYVSGALAAFRLEPAGERPFYARVGIQTVGPLPVIAADGAGYCGKRGRSEIAGTSNHFYVAAIHVAGKASLRYRRDERDLAPGDLFFLGSMHEFEMAMEQPYGHLLVSLPKDLLDARLPQAERLCGSVLPRADPLARLFAAYLAAGYEIADRLPPAATTMFGRHMADLLCEALAGPQPDRDLPVSARGEATFVRACRLIARRSGDPALTPDRIAGELGISTRMLHRAFAGHGETVMRFVLKERVSRAANLLTAPQARHRTITEIAFACGFNDLSHFGRVFADRNGMTPSQWRRQAF